MYEQEERRLHSNVGVGAFRPEFYANWVIPCCTTHAVDAVAAHRCHELWSHTHVAE